MHIHCSAGLDEIENEDLSAQGNVSGENERLQLLVEPARPSVGSVLKITINAIMPLPNSYLSIANPCDREDFLIPASQTSDPVSQSWQRMYSYQILYSGKYLITLKPNASGVEPVGANLNIDGANHCIKEANVNIPQLTLCPGDSDCEQNSLIPQVGNPIEITVSLVTTLDNAVLGQFDACGKMQQLKYAKESDTIWKALYVPQTDGLHTISLIDTANTLVFSSRVLHVAVNTNKPSNCI